MFKTHWKNIALITIVALVFGWQIFLPGFFSMHDDLQVMRLFEMRKCLDDGQIPCRWSPDMGAGFGQPMFNYYSAFPYYLGSIFNLIGFSFISSVKILFLLCLMASGIFTYFLLIQLFSLPAAFIGAVAYVLVPYRAVDIFVRGAMSEVWALALLPLVIGSILSLYKRPTVLRSVVVAVSLFLFLITHNITSLVAFPIILSLSLLLIYLSSKRADFAKHLLLGSVLGLSLSAFFILPIAFERGLVETKYLVSDYYNFRAHFVTLSQLFISNHWGYGPSVFGPDDNFPFSLGYFQVLAIFLLPVLLLIFRKSLTKSKVLISVFFWLLTWFLIFLTHSKSVFIWESIGLLSFIQFPWRLLGPIALGSSVSIACLFDLIPKRFGGYLIIGSLIFMVAINFNKFRFEKLYPQMSDAIKLSGQEYDYQKKSALLDYLPVSSSKIPESIAPDQPEVIDGIANVNYFDHRSNYFSSEFDVYSETVTIRFPVVYFPNWQLYHNRSGVPFDFSFDNDYGQISVNLTKGHHLVQAFFEDTPIRSIGNTISFFSLAVLLILLLIYYEKKEK